MSGDLRIATPTQVNKWTAERRQMMSARMKAQRCDPVFEEKTRAALKAMWASPEFAARRLRELAYQRCSPAYVNFPRLRLLDPVQAEKHAALLRRLNTDPVIVERKKQAIRESWANPVRRARTIENIRRAWDKKRGFRVPKSKAAEYRRLVKSKHFTAMEAGRILGLVK